MAFWLDLMFGSDVGLMAMLTIIFTTIIISFLGCYFVYKVRTAQPEK
ncbi:hypothetical protein GCM10011502_23920 [Oceanisphaera marina]|uniref:DUF3149 domain-containing protein n=1 Tax=Oceanisphaera marina TaxID=2017550 RepID=A0ABQ1IQB4_9GAMM|nr:DUF3149 domain-containing protein [Oceanisphaera marina]GGB49911.1 hypothetical protein GCM10011502_23920 [Oceanisphaera marina]